LNKNICKDYAPVVLNFAEQVNSYGPKSTDNLNDEDMILQCETFVDMANQNLPMFVQMYKEGDIEN
jgi:hypothetical protein